MLRNAAQLLNLPHLATLVPKGRRPNPRKIIIQPAELEAMLAAAPPWMRVLLLLGAHAGLRISDAMRACPLQLSPDKQTLSLIQKKTDHPVTIPLTDALGHMLGGAPQGDPATPFYQLYRGAPITYHGVNGAWQTLKKRTQVNRALIFHDLRRTIAVSVYELSKDLRVAEQMLGHKSLTSTCGYLEHVDPGILRPLLQSIYTPKGPVQ
jgi:integrase